MSPGELWRRLALLVRRDRALRELEEEMRLHQALRARALEGEGLSRAEALRAARRRFGYTLRHTEASERGWGLVGLREFLGDVRHAIRRIIQRPGFSAAIVVVLGLGIGATTAIFSAVDAALLRPLPFSRPEQLVTLPDITVPFDPGTGELHEDGPQAVSIRDIAAMPELFSDVAAFAAGGMNLSEPDHPVRINVGVATVNFFGTLGVAPIAGRTFTPDEQHPGNGRVAVLSWSLWQSHYGGQPMIGRMVRLNNVGYQVVGIMPRGFAFPRESDLWIPMSIPITFETFEPFRGYLPSRVLARVANGISVGAASHQLLARWELESARPGSEAARYNVESILKELRQTGTLVPLQDNLIGSRRTGLLVLLAATGFLLLIACANVMNLLLAQASERRREMAVREVLGATRFRMVRQLLTESAVLALVATAVGMALAPAALGLMHALLPDDLAAVSPAQLDLRVLAFAVILALVTAVGFGLWPAMATSRLAPAEVIKSGGGHGGTAGRTGRLRRALVVAELALTLVLLVGAGLMVRSFQQVMGLDSGLSTERVGTLELAFSREGSTAESRERVVSEILGQLAGTPGIVSTGAVNNLPLGGDGGIGLVFLPDDVPPPSNPDDRTIAYYLFASAGYFKTMGIPILQGRSFREEEGSRVAVISAELARKAWPDRNPIGRTFNNGDKTSYTVIGVAAEVRQSGLEQASLPQMYLPMSKSTPSAVTIVARSALPPAQLLGAMRAAVRAADPSQAVYHVRMMDDVVSASVAPRRVNTVLITLFAALALILATLGVFAVVAFGVAQRSREFGIRTALGATGHDLLAMVSRDILTLVGLGLLLGVIGAWGLTRLMESLVFEVAVHDPLTFIAVSLGLGVVALVAGLLPVRRVFAVNPAEVMRAD